MDDDSKCERYNAYNSNKTYIVGYEGIPYNLLLNFIVWLILMISFVALRIKSWRNQYTSERSPLRNASYNQFGITSFLFYGNQKNRELRSLLSENNSSKSDLENSQKYSWIGWLLEFFNLNDEDIRQHAGEDAVKYLTFMRYLIVYVAVTGFLILTVILPLNLNGILKADSDNFGATTIANIPGDSNYLWAHLILTILFVLFGIGLMLHFSLKTKTGTFFNYTSRTIMIKNISRKINDPEKVKQHFGEAFASENFNILKVQFAIDVRKLSELEEMRNQMVSALEDSKAMLEHSGERPQMSRYYACSCMTQCCGNKAPCWQTLDCIEYYTGELDKIDQELIEVRAKAADKRVGLAFVTFETTKEAETVIRYHKQGCCKTRPSSVSKELKAYRWEIDYAPKQSDINWPYLAVRPWLWWSKAIFVNLCVLFLVFILTTPTYVLKLLNKNHFTNKMEDLNIPPVIVDFTTSIILLLVTVIMPFLVGLSDRLIGHWTKSQMHWAVMLKTFIYLVLVVLILPSLGLTSLYQFLEWLIPRNITIYPNALFRWECVFLPDNGAIFVNYVIASSFIGTAIELIRLPELLVFGLYILMARSTVERAKIRETSVAEFSYGQNYAWVLCLFCIVIANGVLCPLIMPFGFLYLVMKYIVDRYNIYYAYLPATVNSEIHQLAVNCFLSATVLLNINVLVFITLRRNMSDPLFTVGLVFFILIMVALLSRQVFRCCITFTALKYYIPSFVSETEENGDTECQMPFSNVCSPTVEQTGDHTTTRESGDVLHNQL